MVLLLHSASQALILTFPWNSHSVTVKMQILGQFKHLYLLCVRMTFWRVCKTADRQMDRKPNGQNQFHYLDHGCGRSCVNYTPLLWQWWTNSFQLSIVTMHIITPGYQKLMHPLGTRKSLSRPPIPIVDWLIAVLVQVGWSGQCRLGPHLQ